MMQGNQVGYKVAKEGTMTTIQILRITSLGKINRRGLPNSWYG